MTEIVIDKKKYVILSQKDFRDLQKRAALKSQPQNIFTIEEARKHSKKMIRKWAGAEQS